MTTTRLRTIAAVAALCLTVVGCSADVAGTPSGPSFTPPDPATATATVVDLEGALAVSRDGTKLAVVDDSRFCIRDRVPSGAKGTSPTCADDIALGKLTQAAFSPDGRRVVAFASLNSTGFSGNNSATAAIVDTTTGSAVRVSLPDAAAGSSSQTEAPTTTGSSGTGGAQRADAVFSFLWQSNGVLIAVGLHAAVYRVDASTGAGTLVVSAGERPQDGVMMASLGGGTVVMDVVRTGGTTGSSRLVAVSLADGSVRDLPLDLGESRGRPVLMGVSPDGGKVLLSTADLARYVPGETAVYDLASGTRTAVAGTGRTFGVAGGFSPDGTVVALVSSDPIPDGEKGLGSENEYTLRLAPADGRTTPRSVVAADPSTAYGALQWSETGWITGATFSQRGAPAWQLGG